MLKPSLAGRLVLMMLLVTLIRGWAEWIFPAADMAGLYWLSGVSGFAAMFLLLSGVSRLLKVQVALLAGVGVLLMLYAERRGVPVDFMRAVSVNTGLLTMITAVGFLRLVAIPRSEVRTVLPIGRMAYLKTLISVSFFGSLINISAPILIADRIHNTRPIQRFTSQSIIRIFCGCSSWSPFFAAMAVVLTYVEGAQISQIMLYGFPFMLIGLVLVYLEARIRYPSEMDDFVGYPLGLQSIWIPVVLALSVIVGGWLFNGLSILVLIASSALLVTIVTLILRVGISKAISELGEYVDAGLPRVINELALFLSAGILAVGISALIQTGILSMPIDNFDSVTAVQLMVVVVVLGAMGVHPVILISSFTPLILVLDPNPTLLALTYLFAWNLGTCASPLSGTNLVFQGRYGIPSWQSAFWNWSYVVVMVGICVVWLKLIGGLL